MRTIVEENPQNVVVMDVFSKLIQDRIIFIGEDIHPDLSNEVIAQLLYLNSVSKTEPIKVYINSPGGEVIQGFAIYDVVKFIEAPVYTYCVGMAASMGCILLLMGEKRFGLKHSSIMLHELSGSARGTLTEMKISVDEAQRLQNQIDEIILEKTKITDLSDFKFDNWYSSEKALELGILTDIL